LVRLPRGARLRDAPQDLEEFPGAIEHDPARLYYLPLMAPAEQLRELLEATPAGPFLASDNGKFFESVRSVTAVHAADEGGRFS
jgi:hypothetical protein